MGNLFTKKYKNYSFPTHIKSEYNPINFKSISPSKKNHSGFIDRKHETEIYMLKSQQKLSDEIISGIKLQKPKSITLLTYNVWFEGHNDENRFHCILKMIADSQADIICLQEVNGKFLKLLHQYSKNMDQKSEYLMPIVQMHWYDTLILSKYPCRFYKKLFDSSTMGRCSLTAVIEFYEPNRQESVKVGINCVHLESLNSQKFRIEQLLEIEKLNENLDITIIAGDFNFSDGWNENKVIKDYSDIWKMGKRQYGSTSNLEMKQTGFTMLPTQRFPPWRPDHILIKCKSQPKHQKEHLISIIGNFAVEPYQNQDIFDISKDGIVRTPSDHLGLLAKIYI